MDLRDMLGLPTAYHRVWVPLELLCDAVFRRNFRRQARYSLADRYGGSLGVCGGNGAVGMLFAGWVPRSHSV